MKVSKLAGLAALATAVVAGWLPAAQAQDKLKVGAGQRGNYDTAISEVGQRLGIFKKHGLDSRCCGRKARAKRNRR